MRAFREAVDRTAWVFDYTSDAVFDGGGEHAVVGRDSLLAMATSMRPLGEVSIGHFVPRVVQTCGCVDGGFLGQWVGRE